MDVSQAIAQRRSIRRFRREKPPHEALLRVLEAARLAPTTTNRQPLAFALVESDAMCEKVFPHTMWARLIPDGSAGPDEKTQPSCYVVILVDRNIMQNADNDAGAAAMSMLLQAQSDGIASCWLASVERKEILSLLSLDSERYALHTVVALGYPAMQSRAVPMQGDSTAYYLESKDSLCVPKRAAEDILFFY